ncbi:MAG: FadR/GntR family transcriptional regulator [Flavobacteriaceae bacterium]
MQRNQKGQNGPSLSPILIPKASDILASQLRDMIVNGHLRPGDFLPAERQLVAESGISRTSVRDALRILESEGLVTTKVGRSGGSIVTLPAREAVARSVELFVRTHGIRMESLLDCRVAVEPTLAQLAAENRTESQLAEMTELHAEFASAADNVQRYKAANLDWHLCVARASGNEPLIAFMEAISEAIRDAMEYKHTTTPAIRAEAIKAHGVILDAIRQQDGESAFKRMSRHVVAYRSVAFPRKKTA